MEPTTLRDAWITRARIISVSRRRRHAAEDFRWSRTPDREGDQYREHQYFGLGAQNGNATQRAGALEGLDSMAEDKKCGGLGKFWAPPRLQQGNKDGRNGEGEIFGPWMHDGRRDSPSRLPCWRASGKYRARCFLLLEAVQRCTVFGGIYPALAPKSRAAAPPRLSVAVRTWPNLEEYSANHAPPH